MEMTNTRSVPASQEQTWTALNDPETLKACIPGCESIVKVSDADYELTMTARIGPVSAKFKGKMTLADLDPPNAYRLVFEGSGGAAGFAKGGAHVQLAPDGTGTLINYTVNAQVGGKLAQIGSRLIDGAAKKMADDFFACFSRQLEAGTGGETAAPAAVTPATARGGSRGKSVWPWAVAVIAAIVVAYFVAR